MSVGMKVPGHYSPRVTLSLILSLMMKQIHFGEGRYSLFSQYRYLLASGFGAFIFDRFCRAVIVLNYLSAYIFT